MSNQTSIARPYAKALFEHAASTKELSIWSQCLNYLAALIDSTALKAALKNPTVTTEQQTEIILAIMQSSKLELPKNLNSFIALLAQNKRLSVLFDIAIQFEQLKADHERTLAVVVHTFAPLSAEQTQNLINTLSKRLGRQVSLEQVIDEALLGGAVIRANNLVIDGSVKGQLMKLAAELAA